LTAEGTPGVVTRLRIAEFASGRLKLAVLPAPTLKLCQLTIELAELAVTFMVVALVLIATEPVTTLAPVGRSAKADDVGTQLLTATSNVKRKFRRRVLLRARNLSREFLFATGMARETLALLDLHLILASINS